MLKISPYKIIKVSSLKIQCYPKRILKFRRSKWKELQERLSKKFYSFNKLKKHKLVDIFAVAIKRVQSKLRIKKFYKNYFAYKNFLYYFYNKSLKYKSIKKTCLYINQMLPNVLRNVSNVILNAHYYKSTILREKLFACYILKLLDCFFPVPTGFLSKPLEIIKSCISVALNYTISKVHALISINSSKLIMRQMLTEVRSISSNNLLLSSLIYKTGILPAIQVTFRFA